MDFSQTNQKFMEMDTSHLTHFENNYFNYIKK